MNIYGSLESFLEYSFEEPQRYQGRGQRHPQNSPQDSLEALLQDKVDSLKTILNQIGSDTFSRTALSQALLENIDRQYSYLKTKLFELYTWDLGRNRNIEVRRGTLEKQLDKLNEERRREQAESWRDVAKLKEEFRKWFKQYCDLVQRVRIIADTALS